MDAGHVLPVGRVLRLHHDVLAVPHGWVPPGVVVPDAGEGSFHVGERRGLGEAILRVKKKTLTPKKTKNTRLDFLILISSA